MQSRFTHVMGNQVPPSLVLAILSSERPQLVKFTYMKYKQPKIK